MIFLGLNIFYLEISTEITHCTHSNKDQNESKYLLNSSPSAISSVYAYLRVYFYHDMPDLYKQESH